ncbi:hypothetical protein ABH924_003312 [Arthrobacter sp. GAS37]|uniref:hypothetical protein n=1 Tax=Arthrobacter sp. GAS37 TaxID=3156261 RepID=UPI003832584C
MAAPKNLPAQNPVFQRMKRPNRVEEPPTPGTKPETVSAPAGESPPQQVPAQVTQLVPGGMSPAREDTAEEHSSAKPTAPKTLTVFFTDQTRSKFRAKAKRLRLTRPVALMTAIEDSYPELPRLLGGVHPERKVQLFQMPASSRRDAEDQLRDASESMKLIQSNLDVLDTLKDDLGAKSRNDLINVAVEHWVRDEPATN